MNWIKFSERPPKEDGMYLTCCKTAHAPIYQVLPWADGWNCSREGSSVFREYELYVDYWCKMEEAPK